LFTTADQDLELKRMLWSQVFHVSRDPFSINAHQIIIQKQFLKALFLYLDPPARESHPCIAKWFGPQLIDLQIHALDILTNMVPILPKHVHEIGGHKILTIFL